MTKRSVVYPVRLKPEEYKEIKRVARIADVSVGELIRYVLAQYCGGVK
jgi:hypothetical protein